MRVFLIIMVLAVSLNVCFAESTVNQFNLVERYNALVSKTEKFTNVVVSSSPFPSYQYFFDNEIIVDCMSYNENTFSLSIHIDKSNNDIIAVQAYLDEELVSASPNENGAINSIITSLLAAFCEFDDKEINLTVSKIFDDRGNMQEDVRFYRSGFVFEIGFMGNNSPVRPGFVFTITTVDQESYNDGFFWTPYTNDEYMLSAGIIAMEKLDYDLAILFFEQIGAFAELENAQNAKEGRYLNPDQNIDVGQVNQLDEFFDSAVIDLELGFVDQNINTFLNEYRYLGGNYVPTNRDNVYVIGHPAYSIKLTGSETYYYLVEDIAIITARDGVVVAYSQQGLRSSSIQNVYQLLMWLGGSFSTLTEYEPEIIQDGNNAPILRWETKNAYFSIKSNSLPGIEDWRLNKVQNFVVYKK